MERGAATVGGESRLARGLRRAAQLAEHAMTEFFRDGCPQRAASISFYALFSIFPLAIICVTVLGLFFNDAQVRQEVVQFFLDRLPLSEDQGRRQLESLLLQVTRDQPGFGLLGIVTLVFAATGVMAAIRLALNAAFDTVDDRPPLQAKARDLLMVLGFGVLVTLSFALTLLDQIRRSVTTGAEGVLPGAGGVIADILLSAGRVVPLALAVLVFAGLFHWVPARSQRLRDIWPGVVVAAVGYELAKTGFTIYLANFADYGAIYASLGSVVAFLVFVFVAANVALLGAEVAAEWPSVRDGRYDGGPGEPIGKRLLGFVRGLLLRPK